MPPRKRKSTDNVDQAQSKKAKVSGGKADPAKLQSMPHVGKLSEWLLDLNTGYHFCGLGIAQFVRCTLCTLC